LKGGELGDLGDVPGNGLGRDEVLVAEGCRNLTSIKMARGTIALQGADCSGVTGTGVPLGNILDG
jgi:hypothetical protein